MSDDFIVPNITAEHSRVCTKCSRIIKSGERYHIKQKEPPKLYMIRTCLDCIDKANKRQGINIVPRRF